MELAVRQRFDVHVGNAWQRINGKDFMGMFSLDYGSPIRVRVKCSAEEFSAFRASAAMLAG